jgi:acetylornithine deacetylase
MTDDPTLRLLCDLVAIDSVNPSLVAGGAGEGAIAEAVAAELRAIGLDVEIEEVLPGRPNVVGLLQGRASGRRLALCGHIDTVGVAGMEAPFDPVVRDGLLYGRGAGDMKGGVAAMIGAARQIAESGGLDRGSLLVAAVVDEEHASAGAEAFVQRWKADGAVVTEPTDLHLGVVHKGFTWFEVTTKGRAAHGSRPSEGRDAIFDMGRVLWRLEELDRRLQASRAHPLVGPASLHASLVVGGRELSSYPDRCMLQGERRTIPGESADAVGDEVERLLEELRGEDPEFSASVRLMFARPPYETPPGDRLLQAFDAALGASTPARVGLSFWTDAAVLGGAGIPSVLFGPGGGNIHGLEEFVRLADVGFCQDALARVARWYCG